MKKKALIFGFTFMLIFLASLSHAEVLMIPAAAFRPGHHGCEYYTGDTITNVNYIEESYYAPVYLPQGAKVKKVFLYYYADGSWGISVYLNRRNCNTDTTQNMASISGYASGPNWDVKSTTAIDYPKINMKKFGYYLRLFFESAGPNYKVQGVKIVYTTS